jgi:hypothetical protein
MGASVMLMSDSRLVHFDEQQNQHELASEIVVADSTLAKTRGLMFTSGVLEHHALRLDWSHSEPRLLHMLAVPAPIDAIWCDGDDRVTQCKRLSAIIGVGRARARTVYELPAGAASDVAVGDRVRVMF